MGLFRLVQSGFVGYDQLIYVSRAEEQCNAFLLPE